jgi:hypothetical protein
MSYLIFAVTLVCGKYGKRMASHSLDAHGIET